VKYATLEECILEAERFLKRAQHLQKRLSETHRSWPQHPHVHIDDHEGKSTTADIAAVRRSSLDLTKVLAHLRGGR